MVGVVGFEPTTPASRTQCAFSKLLIFLTPPVVSGTFCSRSFHLIRCDFVAAFSRRTRLPFLMSDRKNASVATTKSELAFDEPRAHFRLFDETVSETRMLHALMQLTIRIEWP